MKISTWLSESPHWPLSSSLAVYCHVVTEFSWLSIWPAALANQNGEKRRKMKKKREKKKMFSAKNQKIAKAEQQGER